MLKIMEGCGRLVKDGHNDFQNYDYVTEASAVSTFRKLLIENGVVVLPSLMPDYSIITMVRGKDGGDKPMTTIYVKYQWIHVATGEQLETIAIGQGIDSGDKGAYKAMTGANKYMIMKALQLPTGDDPEGDEKTDKQASHKPQTTKGVKSEQHHGEPDDGFPSNKDKTQKCGFCGEWHIEKGEIITKTGKQREWQGKMFDEYGAVACRPKQEQKSGGTSQLHRIIELEKLWGDTGEELNGPTMNKARMEKMGTIAFDQASPAGLKNYLEFLEGLGLDVD